MDSLTTHPSTAQQAKAFTSPASLSFPGGAGDLTPPSEKEALLAQAANGQVNGQPNGQVNAQVNGQQAPAAGTGKGAAAAPVAPATPATPATPAATPGAGPGVSGIVPTLQ